MKAFITKYALTQGILEKEVEKSNFSENMVTAKNNSIEHYHKPYWHETKEEAINHANEMKNKRILALRRRIKKLEKINFSLKIDLK